MLDELTSEEAAEIVEGCFGAAALPHLTDEAARQRAAAIARQQGLVERIEAELADDRPIPVLPYGLFRDFRRTGNRRNFEVHQRGRGRQIELAAMACLLGADKMTYLQDLLWAECEATWWVMPAHERHGSPIDLRVAMAGASYATIVTMFRDRMEPEVRERVIDEVHRRLLRPYLHPACTFRWKTVRNNWNAVCLGGVGIAALLVESEPARLGRLIADALAHLPSFLASFTDDGGCSEGPGYWRFGFGWYIRLAAALHDYTGGRIDIASGQRIERICRYPLAVAVAPGVELTFADSHGAHMDPAVAQLINRFHDVPELFGLCKLRDDGTAAVETLEGLLLYDGRTCEPFADRRDRFLPDLGVAHLKAGELSVGAKAGHNAENHNHNDVGSFLVFRGGTCYLTDPGAPIYSARTFSSRRYESIFCNSFGHSVPVIDGQLQASGADRGGTISVEGLDGEAAKTVRLELAGAYEVGSLRRLTRRIEVDGAGQQVGLTDEFVFDEPPGSVEEAFITTQPAEAADGGDSVTIRPPSGPAAVLSAADCGGRFAVTELAEQSAAESRTGQIVRRIAFTPAELAGQMTLRFVLRFGTS